MFAILPFKGDVTFKKGDRIGQGVISKFYLTDDDIAEGLRTGGWGSTTLSDAFAPVFNTDTLKQEELNQFFNGAT